ncbi:MAG: hypothetical protein KUG73_11580 [Pseudomonadales bacterium]|nr:hypothetical protein [Pseudomonadales bacterium]
MLQRCHFFVNFGHSIKTIPIKRSKHGDTALNQWIGRNTNDDSRASLKIYSDQDLGSLQKPMVERDFSAIYMIFKALLQTDTPLNSIRVTWNESNPKESALYQKLLH